MNKKQIVFLLCQIIMVFSEWDYKKSKNSNNIKYRWH